MRAAYYVQHGGPDVLRVGDLDDPRPGPGEVRVRVAVSGLTPSDVLRRGGRAGPMAFPRIVPHSDGAGTIAAVGEGVEPGRVGSRVWVYNAQWRRPFGTVDTPGKAEVAHAAGAHVVLGPGRLDIAEEVLSATGRHGVDRIVEVALGENLAEDTKMLAEGGVIAAYQSATDVKDLPFRDLE